MMNKRLGVVRAQRLPRWLREGYADHIAQESSLTEAEARRLRRMGVDHPALFYVDARKKVEAELRNGVSVSDLVQRN